MRIMTTPILLGLIALAACIGDPELGARAQAVLADEDVLEVDEVDADVPDPDPDPDPDDTFQPNCVDERLPEDDDVGDGDGESCDRYDDSAYCVMTSPCPVYCVSCDDGSSGCYACGG